MDDRLVIIGGDAGNGYIKLSYSETNYQIPALVARGKVREFARLLETFNGSGNVEEQLNVLDVRIEDHQAGTSEHYFCGQLAAQEGIPISQWADDKGSSEGSKALLLTLMAATLPTDKAIIYLSTSLPVKNYARYKKSYEEHMAGDFTVEFLSGPLQGKRKMLKIIRCRVYPEGLGVYIREVHNQQREILTTGIQVIVAPGFRTTEFLFFRDGKLVDELTGSLEFGIASAHKKVANYLSQSCGIECTEHEIDRMFMAGAKQRIQRDKFVNVKDLCEDGLSKLAETIISRLRIKWQDAWNRIENFVISDGGGQVLIPYIQKQLAECSDANCYLVDNPQFATAQGNRLAAVLALSGGNKNGHS